MASFLKKGLDMGKSATGKVTGKTEIERLEKELEDEKHDKAVLEKKHASTVAALEDAELKLTKERQAKMDAIANYESLQADIDEEKNSEREAEQKARQDEMQAALEAMDLDSAAKEKALADCLAAYEAMKSVITDDLKLAGAICPNSNAQLELMQQMYLSNYGQDLRKRVKKNTGGSLRILLLGLLDGPVKYQTDILKHAVSGIATDENGLIDILCPATNEELKELKDSFQATYGKDLAEKVTKSTSGTLEKLLTIVLQAGRDQADTVDDAQVTSDAQALYEAGQGKTFGTDDAVFNQIIGQRSATHMIALNEKYRTTNKKELSLVEAIEKQYSGAMKRAYMTIVESLLNPAKYWAGQAEIAMHGLGCDDLALIRVLLIRREKNMPEIKLAYSQQGHKRPFSNRVLEELGGNLGKAAVMAIGE